MERQQYDTSPSSIEQFCLFHQALHQARNAAQAPAIMPLPLGNQASNPSRQPATPYSSWIPNLLGPHKSKALDTMSFRLVVRQQPQAARTCGFCDRDRRSIDPPPIVQLSIDAPDMDESEVRTYTCFTSYVMTCSMLDESGTRDASALPEEFQQHRRRITGSLISTPFAGKDEHGTEGCFFAFPDISCRVPGAYRLKFTLVMI